jgi:hypothetical protein
MTKQKDMRDIYFAWMNIMYKYDTYSEIGSRASSKNASTSSSPNNFEYSAAIAVFSYVQKRATQRTNRPLPTIETQGNQVVYIFF